MNLGGPAVGKGNVAAGDAGCAGGRVWGFRV